MQARKMAGMAVAVVLFTGGAALGQTHAPWPTNWNNWSDPALLVTVGNPGNAPDTRYNNISVGAVAYEYKIGMYEVTAGQYTAFLNAVAKADTYGLYNTEMDAEAHEDSGHFGCNIKRTGSSGSYEYSVAPDYANRPVNYVSWGDSVRFANWLTNGQGSGSTETGAYNLSGAMTDAELMAVVVPTASQRATWSNGATSYFLLTSEDEWYKAAYHDKNAVLVATYFNYPTSSNSVPGNDMTEATNSGNNVNYGVGPVHFPIDSDKYYTTVAGEFQNSDSPYGTFDQGGNVFEWNEVVLAGSYHGARGGSFGNVSGPGYLHASDRVNGFPPTYEGPCVGFRVVVVPEPATLSLLALGGLALMRRRRR